VTGGGLVIEIVYAVDPWISHGNGLSERTTEAGVQASVLAAVQRPAADC
jgi:hypothetical protein